VDGCRARIDADLAAYDAAAAGAEFGDFEATFFNNMVLVLDHYFVHRLRTVEGKDGNPLNEVRVVSDSLMLNNGIMTADKTINLDPAKSVLNYAPGDRIKLGKGDFERLCDAYFAEIQGKFT
jgi:hypothetical protein